MQMKNKRQKKTEYGLGDAPIQKEYRVLMNELAVFIDKYFNEDLNDKKVGFCLMVFNFGDGPGRANYISNAQRNDIITLLKEQVKRFEGQAYQTGRA
jgi:hypothetical protein